VKGVASDLEGNILIWTAGASHSKRHLSPQLHVSHYKLLNKLSVSAISTTSKRHSIPRATARTKKANEKNKKEKGEKKMKIALVFEDQIRLLCTLAQIFVKRGSL